MNQPADAGTRPAGVSWLALGLGLVAFVILVGLGTWQVQRLSWKEGLIASIEARVKSPPRPLSEVEDLYARTKDVDYTPVELSGRFLNDRESHFFATWKGESGFYVYTPLALDDGRAAMVNRGFVPYDRKDPATRPRGQVEGEVTITGLARNPLDGKPSWVVPENDIAGNVFYWKDLGAMAGHAGIPHERLLPFFVDAGDEPNPGGLPVGGVTMIDLPNNHLQYAFTWYGLAAVLAVILGLWTWGRIRQPRP
jgi:surfeit locus 1 family protein